MFAWTQEGKKMFQYRQYLQYCKTFTSTSTCWEAGSEKLPGVGGGMNCIEWTVNNLRLETGQEPATSGTTKLCWGCFGTLKLCMVAYTTLQLCFCHRNGRIGNSLHSTLGLLPCGELSHSAPWVSALFSVSVEVSLWEQKWNLRAILWPSVRGTMFYYLYVCMMVLTLTGWTIFNRLNDRRLQIKTKYIEKRIQDLGFFFFFTGVFTVCVSKVNQLYIYSSFSHSFPMLTITEYSVEFPIL